MNTQLLCTFCSDSELDATIKFIVGSYTVAFNSIYVLENTDDPTSLCLTYNIDRSAEIRYPIPAGTISLHRKKQTNTLYTINALNRFVEAHNGGKADKGFLVPWETVRNCILVTTYNQFRKIPTRVRQIVDTRTVS
jgi:hypothetical protein